jgi:hypothetical protein
LGGGINKKKQTCEIAKCVKGAKLEDLEGVLVIWTGQVNAKIGTATDEAIEEQAKIFGQQMNVAND